MKRYRFEVILTEGSDEFWDALEGRTGCDEILEEVRNIFDSAGWEPEIRLVEYTDSTK